VQAQLQLPEKIARCYFTTSAPQIDGLVDEVWLETTAQDSFIQREPYQGEIAGAETKFYILYDDQYLYFLFVMLDDWPGSIPARVLERDQDFSPDDHINFYLDTYNDHRRAYFFSTNPAGIERDGLISENGSNLDITWDGIFSAAARINDLGWVAEFAIPFTTLRFNDDVKYQVWGFNVWRIQKRNRETSYWSLVEQDFRKMRLDRGGALIGMQNVRSGHQLTLLPYLTARNITAAANKENDLQAGLDLKYGLTSDLTLDLTLNPDFGQVEIDQEQINLDKRYEILIEEKRPFFLENTNLFQAPSYQMFYSRRIGAQSDIKAGGKLTGKVGSLSLGALGAYTGKWESYNSIPGLGDPNTSPSDELFSVLRVQGDILTSSNLGAMYVGRSTNLGGKNQVQNRAGGVDLTISSGQFYLQGQGVYTYNADSEKKRTGFAGYASTGYYNSLYRADIYTSSFTPDFDLDSLGFFPKIPEKGTTQAGLYLDVHPLVNTSILRSWGLSLNPAVIKDTDEIEYGAGVISNFWLEFRDQSRITLEFTPYRDTEHDNFYYLFRLRKLPDLTYWGTKFAIVFKSDFGKSVALQISVDTDRQYYFQTHSNGINRGVEAFLRLKPYPNAFLELGFQNRQFLDDEGRFVPNDLVGQSNIKIWSARGRYLFSKNIFTRLFLQHTNGAEDFVIQNGTTLIPLRYEVWNRMSANFLLGWRFLAGSTAYIAWTEEWDRRETVSYRSVNRILFFKISYLWGL
jgi:hypothetical protein